MEELADNARARKDTEKRKLYLKKAGINFSAVGSALVWAEASRDNPQIMRNAAKLKGKGGEKREALAEIYWGEGNYEKWEKYLGRAAYDYEVAVKNFREAAKLERKAPWADYQAVAEFDDRTVKIRKKLAGHFEDKDKDKWLGHLRGATRHGGFSARYWGKAAKASSGEQAIGFYRIAADRSEDSIEIMERILASLAKGTPEWESNLKEAARELGFSGGFRAAAGELEAAVRLEKESGKKFEALASFFEGTRREKWTEYLAHAAKADSFAGRYLGRLAENKRDADLFEEAARLLERAERVRRNLITYFRQEREDSDEVVEGLRTQARQDESSAQACSATAERIRGE
jgi:hypothetical protein